MLCVPVAGKTLMKTGLRVSATRSKEQKFDDKEESKEAFAKAKESVQAQENTKDIWRWVQSVVLPLCLALRTLGGCLRFRLPLAPMMFWASAMDDPGNFDPVIQWAL